MSLFTRLTTAAVLIAGLAVALTLGHSAGAQTSAADTSRGAYLTGPAGQCADCHQEGLKGGPNMIPGPPGAPWAKVVPSLRGLSMFKTDADAIAFLTTAKLPDGTNALPPMPHFMFNVADATAIVSYLRSLK